MGHRVRHNANWQQQPACIKMLHDQPPFTCEELLAASLCKKPEVCALSLTLLILQWDGLSWAHCRPYKKWKSSFTSFFFFKSKRMDRQHTLGKNAVWKKLKEIDILDEFKCWIWPKNLFKFFPYYLTESSNEILANPIYVSIHISL